MTATSKYANLNAGYVSTILSQAGLADVLDVKDSYATGPIAVIVTSKTNDTDQVVAARDALQKAFPHPDYDVVVSRSLDELKVQARPQL